MVLMSDQLANIKNITETMSDLAYAAVYFQETAFTTKVHELYQQKLKLVEQTRSLVSRMNKDHQPTITQYLVYLKELGTNAVFIADLAKHEQIPSEARTSLQKSNERIIEALVHYSSFFADKTLGELKVQTFTKARILAVRRFDNWILDINKDFRFQPNDAIVAMGTPESERLLHAAVDKSSILD